jgi:DNA-binding transcriptional ArsR family regulator
MSEHIEARDSSLSELFEILSHEYRRRILIAVGQHNPQDIDDITSESIADGAEDEPLEVLQQRLFHVHLPKLDKAGFVNWDQDTGVVTRGPRFEEIEPLLTLMREHRDELPDGWP